jgi:FkbH-like protein
VVKDVPADAMTVGADEQTSVLKTKTHDWLEDLMINVPSGAITISATFTAEPLLPSLSFILELAGLPLDVRCSPYHQVFQALLSDSSLLIDNAKGINIVLIRIEDFIRDELNEEAALATVTRTAEELSKALASFAIRAKVPTIVSVFPPSPRASQFRSALDAANAQLTSHITTLPGIILLPTQEIDRVSADDQFDNVSDELAHVPFTENHYASLALAIARKVHAALVPAHKVLVLDCDNTLWRGVVGEDGVDGIEVTPAFANLQNFAIKAHSQGALVCLVSKNSERDVLDVFEQRSDMLLKIDLVVAHRINWESKPQNIASLAKELNLGLESFVFMDDNPVECALMQAELLQVVTLQIPPEAQMESFLANVWTFDKIAVTDEDLRRTQMYKENAARVELEATATNIGDFIASLEVRVDIETPNDADWPRLAQLTQRTNQFNFTTQRRTELELRKLAAEGCPVLRINVQDRFGKYGLIGLVVAKIEADRLYVDTFLLSCRVLGRGVEHAILRSLGDMARSLRLSTVAIPFVATKKNEPARAFVESVAAQFRTQDKQNSLYLIPASGAMVVTHHPGFDPQAIIEASRSTDRTEPSQMTNMAGRSDRYTQFARQLISGRAVNAVVHSKASLARTLECDPAIPTNDIERQMLALWEELLGITGLGIDDDYFALGGSSLTAARLFAEITRKFGVKLPLTIILSSSTIRKLSQQIGAPTMGAMDSLIQLKDGGPRNLFLIHDGDGETLLYTNLARYMENDISVFGVNPLASSGVPLAHARVEDMASFYIREIRKKQPRGPYLLGGMCAGGVIAYEMASQLLQNGESVDFVVLLDAATPQASHKPHRLTKERLRRLSELFRQTKIENISSFRRTTQLLTATSPKVWNAVKWELTSRSRKWSVRARFSLLGTLLKRRKTWPRVLPALTARQIYECAEATYIPRKIVGPQIVLMRASIGDSGDTPYVQLYSDSTLGWGAVASHLTLVDVKGGHFSMLQEPFVQHLAGTLAQLFVKPRSVSQERRSPLNEPV